MSSTVTSGTNKGTHTDVLIVGAGPTGLALAVDLARRGIGSLLVERADGLFPGSRGKGVQPRTREVFDDLGVGAAIGAAAWPLPARDDLAGRPAPGRVPDVRRG